MRHNIATYGVPGVRNYLRGYVEQTPPHFKNIVMVYLDVDLASATRMILKYVYPLLQPGAWLLNQDGHLFLMAAIFDDKKS